MEHASAIGRLFARSTPRRLLVASPFVAVAVVLVALAIFFMELLSAARAYVGGESLWTKAQKQAVQSLVRFAQLRDGEEWRAYQQAIAVPLGDRVAREELEKPAPDFEAARRGFIAGGNHPDDIAGMIRLFRWFCSDDRSTRRSASGPRPAIPLSPPPLASDYVLLDPRVDDRRGSAAQSDVAPGQIDLQVAGEVGHPELLRSRPLSAVTVSCSVAASAERAAKFNVIVPPLSSQLALNDRPSMSRTVEG